MPPWASAQPTATAWGCAGAALRLQLHVDACPAPLVQPACLPAGCSSATAPFPAACCMDCSSIALSCLALLLLPCCLQVGTQGLMKKLKAQPEDILQLRVTKRERNTLWVDLRLNRLQAAASDGVEGSGAQTGGGAATEGGGGGGTSVPASGAAAGGEAVDSRAPAASGAAAGGGAAVSGAGLARGGSVGGALPTSSAAAADEVNPQPPEHSESEYIGSDDDDDDGAHAALRAPWFGAGHAVTWVGHELADVQCTCGWLTDLLVMVPSGGSLS